MKRNFPALILLVASVGLEATDGTHQPGQTTTKPPPTPPYYRTAPPREKLPATLDPETFQASRTRDAYRVARQTPETLAQLPCYCYCDRIEHKSLLDCYADPHAEFCDICQEEALLAQKLSSARTPVEKIREEIIREFSTRRR